MIIGGIDGCRAGWLLVKHDGNSYSYGVYAHFRELIEAHSDVDSLLIDIPIGLSAAQSKRTIDQVLREELTGRASTVFNAPCRAAVYAEDHHQARLLNQQIEGKSLSIQSLFIKDKIREVDAFLLTKESNLMIWESHPELCFKYLNDEVVVQTRKATPVGLQERLHILARYDTGLPDLFSEIQKNTKRKDVKLDDIVDAICLCLVHRLGLKNGLQFLRDKNTMDDQNLLIRIAYYAKA